jgi:integrase
MKTDLSSKKEVAALPIPATVQALHWDAGQKHFGLAISPKGKRTWILERRVAGKTVRRTLGDYGRLSYKDALSEFKIVDGELEQGVDAVAQKKAAKASAGAAKASEKPTLAAALSEYVESRQRTKDGKALKERTKADYLAMVAAPRLLANGNHTAGGELFPLASVRIDEITGDQVRDVFKVAATRGTRRGTYSMQVLRAVMNWYGVEIPDNPLGKAVAGKDRIVLAATAGKPNPIPLHLVHAWWQASYTVRSQRAAAMLRLMLLTGCRGIEVKALKVGDVDLVGNRLRLTDTKNRSDHVVYLSTQAAEILAPLVKGKKSSDMVFAVEDAGKTMGSICKKAGMASDAHTPHHLRHTFASIAEGLVSVYAFKAMMNHAIGGDVSGFYVGKSEQQLRAGWQAVADFVTNPA